MNHCLKGADALLKPVKWHLIFGAVLLGSEYHHCTFRNYLVKMSGEQSAKGKVYSHQISCIVPDALISHRPHLCPPPSPRHCDQGRRLPGVWSNSSTLSHSRPGEVLLLDFPKYGNDTKRVNLPFGGPDLSNSDWFLEGTRNEIPVLNLPRPGSARTLFECACPKEVVFWRWSSFAIAFSRLWSYLVSACFGRQITTGAEQLTYVS